MSAQISITKSAREVLIRIDAAVAQEWPVAPRAFDLAEVAFDDQYLLGARACLTDNFPERIGVEGRPPKFQIVFDTNPIGHRDKHSVGDRMAALNRDPRIEHLLAILGSLAVPPSDRGRI